MSTLRIKKDKARQLWCVEEQTPAGWEFAEGYFGTKELASFIAQQLVHLYPNKYEFFNKTSNEKKTRQ
jgi:hypothetical protein